MTTKQRQNLLHYLGYYIGIPDDVYGPRTKQAVEDFQRSYGISVDGVAGAETDKALRHAVAYGMPEDGEPDEGQVVKPQTGTFWDEIKHFTRDEAFISCPCGKCGGFPAEPTEALIRAADAVREHFGAPLIPTSTVRCPEHNAAVGGVKTSRHLAGRAMDFYVKGHGSAEVLDFVRTLNPGYAYAIDGGAVHMDF